MLYFRKMEPQMKKVTIVISCILFCTHINGMKRPRTYIVDNKNAHDRENNPAKRFAIDPAEKEEIVDSNQAIVLFDCGKLPPELQKLIICFAAAPTGERKPRLAAKTVNALALTHRLSNKVINDPTFSDQLIKDFAHKYCCPQETVARFLQTEASRKRLALQDKLRTLCFFNNDAIIKQQAGILIRDGVDLEFTYHHHGCQQTVLMISLSYRNCMFELLLENGANVNGHSWSPLHIAAVAPSRCQHLPKLIDHPSLDINKQNGRGETPLLRSLIEVQKQLLDLSSLNLIIELLEKGADPEIPNKRGLTPARMAQYTRNAQLITLIDDAIAKKKEKQMKSLYS